jgi:hypothetical protein
MGNGTMSKPLGADLMKQMRTEYDKMSSLGYGDHVIHEKLQAAYEKFMTTVSPSST